MAAHINERLRKYYVEIGQQFDRWTVIALAKPSKKNEKFWIVRCLCGNEGRVSNWALGSGNSLSCGCLRRERAAVARVTHGETRTVDGKIVCTPEYHSWSSMIQRCYKSYVASYKSHGARGITVCSRWLESFQNFLDDMGRKPDPTWSLDRIDNNGNYEPGNVRWASSKIQSRNTSRNRYLTVGSETILLVEWAEKTGVNYATLRCRLEAGWSPERAIINRRFHKNERGKDFSL